MSRKAISIVTALIVVAVSISLTIGCGPTEPATYKIYHDEQGRFSFSYPIDWREATEQIEEEIEKEPEMEDMLEQGIFALVTFQDPSESGMLLVVTIDFEKLGEPVPELDEFECSILVAAFGMGMGDFHMLSSKETTIGLEAEGGQEKAWEFVFEGKMDGADSCSDAFVTKSASRVYVALFLCKEIAYDTLKPAYHNFKETFRFQ